MKSRREFSATCCKRYGLLGLLMACLLNLSPVAFAQDAPKLPEDVEKQTEEQRRKILEPTPLNESDDPALISPGAGTPPAAVNTETGVVMTPPTPEEVLAALIRQDVFPAEAATRTEPLTRAELTDVMVRALKYPSRYVSEFPFYLDVSLDHWAYVPIEVARLRNLMIPRRDGYFNPDEPATRMAVFWGMSNALTERTISPETAHMLLEPFSDKNQLSEIQARPAALLVNARILSTTPTRDAATGETVPPRLAPDDPVTYWELAPMVARLLDVTTKKPYFITKAPTDFPDVPAGAHLTISPTSAIFEARMDVGDTLYFTLEESDVNLPKGSRLEGHVVGLTPDGGYVVRMAELRTVEDVYWEIAGTLEIKFPSRGEQAFIVPGETFDLITAPVPAIPTPAVNFGQQPAPPAASSGNT